MNDKLERIGGRQMTIGNSLKSMAKSGKEKPILVLDRSGSMADMILSTEEGKGHERKIDALRRIVFNLRGQADFEQLIFDDEIEWTEVIPDPRGGTDLAGALRRVAADKPGTRRCVVVTDGWPNERSAAISAAKDLPCPLDVFYVGNLSDTCAQQFLKELAEAAGGKFGAMDLGRDADALENKVRLALTAGDPEEIAKGPIAL